MMKKDSVDSWNYLSSRLGSPLTPTKELNFPFGNEHSSLLCLILVLLAGYQVL